MATKVDDMIDRLIAREGGAKLVNDPDDPGKLTKYGISKRSYPSLDITNLSYDAAKDIYIRDFYLGNHVHLLPVAMQEPVLDFCVHSGGMKAVVQLQRLLGATADGVIGPQTVAKLATVDVPNFIAVYNRERIAFLIRQVVDRPTKLKYLLGWVMRVLNLPPLSPSLP